MSVTIDLPEDISAALEEQWDDVPRRSLEALAVEAYRTGALTESQVRRLLGFETRFQVHALLKEHEVALRYTAADLKEDRAAHRQLRGMLSTEAGKSLASAVDEAFGPINDSTGS
jgi:predicted HTH domain antitoxin